MHPNKAPNLLAGLVLLAGSSAMLGHIVSSPALKGLGLASTIAPYPKVFCAAKCHDDERHFETFAADFALLYHDSHGEKHRLVLTPELYQELTGPYMRRNVYGAVLAYGPALPPDLRNATLSHALANPATIREELQLPSDAQHLQIEIAPRTRGFDRSPMVLNVPNTSAR